MAPPNMEIYRKKRTVSRRNFTNAGNTLENLMQLDDKNVDEISAAKDWLEQKAIELFACDDKLEETILSMEDESSMLAEIEQIESYKFRYFKLKSKSVKIENTSKKNDTMETVTVRKFVLPKIELRSFNGEVQNWLGFWGQFRKIDEDDGLDDDDKFQYLIQATVPGSSARQLVESFPPSGPNYVKAITVLKKRFARDELIIEYHIRELLKLVLNKNSLDGRLRTSYDRLMTQIHALDALNVTKEKYATILYPMVESTLPEDVLRAWERYRSSKRDDTFPTPLTGLLAFLEREVDGEERIEMAKNGFEAQEPSTSVLPTSACIVAGQKRNEKSKEVQPCIWCDRVSHSSSECITARSISLSERIDTLKYKRACFKCLREGHNASKCEAIVKCIVCQRCHFAILCPDLAQKAATKETTMLSFKKRVTLLPTLLVSIKGAKSTATVRALVDSGSQRSYIKKDVAKKLGLREAGKENFSNSLFGGGETKLQEHKVYDIEVKSLTTNVVLPLRVVDQNKICSQIPRLQGSNEITAILNRNKIELSDQGNEQMEIGLLIGADYFAGLMTGELITLDENLVAIKTTLGWTIQGRTNGIFQSSDSSTVKGQKLRDSDALEFFKNAVTINSETPDLDAVDHKSVNSRMKYLNHLREEFRSRFTNKYLGMLVYKGKDRPETLDVGDIVLVEADVKRVCWPLGVILETYPGRDGIPRVAKYIPNGVTYYTKERYTPLICDHHVCEWNYTNHYGGPFLIPGDPGQGIDPVPPYIEPTPRPDDGPEDEDNMTVSYTLDGCFFIYPPNYGSIAGKSYLDTVDLHDDRFTCNAAGGAKGLYWYPQWMGAMPHHPYPSLEEDKGAFDDPNSFYKQQYEVDDDADET